MLSIGAVVPFLAVILMPEKVFYHAFAQPMIVFFRLNSPQDLIEPIGWIFCSVILVSGVVRVVNVWLINHLSYGIGSDVCINVFSGSVYNDYETHISSNSSELMNSIISKINVLIVSVIHPCITLGSCSVLLVILTLTFSIANFELTVYSFIGITLLYVFVFKSVRNSLKLNGKRVSSLSDSIAKLVSETMGAMRDIIIDNNQSIYLEQFSGQDKALRSTQAKNNFIGASPRYIVETVGIILIAFFALYGVGESEDMTSRVALLGGMAFGLQRLLPVFQQFYAAFTGLRSGEKILDDIVRIMSVDNGLSTFQSNEEIAFVSKIELDAAAFSYSKSSKYVFEDLSLSISKGETVGFLGESGAGKTTVVDCIMGLLNLTRGDLLIDGVVVNPYNVDSFRKLISHVPQSVFLIDGSIIENIAFGVSPENIDLEQVEKVVQAACLDGVISNLKDGYKTNVGERGVFLSGGQLQRIGIARALYKRNPILVFDEATSALDLETEEKVLKAVKALTTCTVIIISHRKTTFKNCSKIFTLKKGRFSCIAYDELASIEETL